MPGGRPSLYRSEFCEQVVEWGKQGKSKAWMASQLDISRETLDQWCKTHEEFSDAMTRARAHAQAWWEDQGQIHMVMPVGAGTFNASVWSRSMAARFPDDWREKTEQAVTGADGKPFELITRRVVDPKKE